MMEMSLNISQNISLGANYIPETELSKTIRYIVFGIIFVLTLVGNITVCVIPYKNRRMRTFTYFLITNLSVSDAAGILYLPFILYQAEHKGYWPFGEAMCKIVNPSITFFGIVTTNTLVAIALDRFVALVFPFKSRPGHKQTIFVIALVWLVALLCVLPAFAVRVVQNDFCVEMFPGQSQEDRDRFRRVYNVFLYLLNNCIPVVIIMLLYIKIVMQLRRNSVSIQKEKKSSSKHRSAHLKDSHEQSRTPGERTVSLTHCTDLESLRKRHKMEKEFTNMLIMVVLVFVFCYVPYQTFFFVAEFAPSVYTWKYLNVVYPYLYVMMWLPNALNPVCYGSMNEQYAKAFRSLLRCTSQSQIYIRERLNSLSHVPTTALLSISTRSNANKEGLQQNSIFSSEMPENHNAGADSGSHSYSESH